MAQEKEAKKPITFRVGKAYMDQLEQQGDELGISRNEFARHLVTRSLNNAAESELRQELAATRDELRTIRRELRDITELLLMKLDSELEEDEVHQYVADELGVI